MTEVRIHFMDNLHNQDQEAIRKRIMDLLSESGKSDRELEEYLRIGRGRIAHWRYEKNTTFLQYITPMCEYFGTSPNYMFYGTEDVDEPAELSPNEKNLIKMYRAVSKDKQRYVMEGLRLFTKHDCTEKRTRENDEK